MKKAIKITAYILLTAILAVLVWIYTNLKDKNAGYKADITVSNQTAAPLRAGFAAVAVTPEVPDRWTDINNDAEYNPKDGDTFTDGNGNGSFDPVWIAGFSNARAANGIHDDLWARSMVLDDGTSRIAFVALDAIGFMNNEVIDIRKRLPKEAGITYLVVSSTHSHEVPDLLGLWGKSPFSSGIDLEYMEFVKSQIIKSIVSASGNLRNARLEISWDSAGAAALVKDTRDPQVFDYGLRLIKAVDRDNGSTLGSLIVWGNHPETLWSKNLMLTSDFVHYLREGVEKGIYRGDTLVRSGIGGVAVYINSAVGGLMTTHPSLAVKDPVTGIEYSEPDFHKAEAEGKQLALLVLKAMETPSATVDSAAISLVARSVEIPIDNKMFRLATAVGLLERGTCGWMKIRSEVAVIQAGPISFSTMPGEVYPEILNGGIEAPEGADFGTGPVEVPPVRDMMPGRYKFVFGLANDEIGYIIPLSQWDVEAPFTYNRSDSPYGEENSMGPLTAGILHETLKEMIKELHENVTDVEQNNGTKK